MGKVIEASYSSCEETSSNLVGDQEKIVESVSDRLKRENEENISSHKTYQPSLIVGNSNMLSPGACCAPGINKTESMDVDCQNGQASSVTVEKVKLY